jgi:hypothetical protein
MPCFIGRGQASAQHERSHIRERDLADQFFVQIVAAHENAMQLGFAESGDDFRLFRHFLIPPRKNVFATPILSLPPRIVNRSATGKDYCSGFRVGPWFISWADCG